MAEIMEEKKELTPAETAAPASPETPAKKPEKSTADKKKRRRTIRRIVALVVVAALIAGGVKFFKKKDGSSEVGMATVSYGAISSEVDGSGLVKAKNSETISLTTAGTVMDVFVEEGQKVEQGDPLFTIDSPNAATEVQKARDEVEGYQKQINTLQKDIAGLNLSPSYAGKLMDVVTLNPGDEISKGTKVAVLADDTRMRLEQYYSYAYAGDLKAGQTVSVSIPALMSTISGTVEAGVKVSVTSPISGEVTNNSDGSFSFVAKLSFGENDIVIVATKGEETSTLTHTVTYEPTYSEYVNKAYKMDYANLATYAGNDQPFLCSGQVVEVFQTEPYTCTFNVGTAEDPKYIYLQMVPGKSLEEGKTYKVYADVDATGTKDGYPYMIGRFFLEVAQ